jgi:hypothetical protein
MKTTKIGNTTVVQGPHDVVFVTRPSMISHKVHTVPFAGVRFAELVEWLDGKESRRFGGISNKMVQDAFPSLTNAEREFLMTGITDEEWQATFGEKENKE